jgi:integrase
VVARAKLQNTKPKSVTAHAQVQPRDGSPALEESTAAESAPWPNKKSMTAAALHLTHPAPSKGAARLTFTTPLLPVPAAKQTRSGISRPAAPPLPTRAPKEVRSRIAESALLTLADYARHRLATILDDTELATLFAHLKERPLYMPVLLAAFTGMRRGEVLALRWSDVDLERAELEVRQVVELVGRKMSFKDPKTERSRMTISLPDRLVQELRTYRKKQWEQSFKRGLGRFPLLFPTWEGKVWNPSHFTKAFSREVEAAKPRHVTFHGLRHPHHSLTS